MIKNIYSKLMTTKHNKKKSAFTLIELIVVIAIIAILAAALTPSFTGYINDWVLKLMHIIGAQYANIIRNKPVILEIHSRRFAIMLLAALEKNISTPKK